MDNRPTDLVTRPTVSNPADAAFYSWWYASHKRPPTEDERVMWTCGYTRGLLVGKGLAGDVFDAENANG